MFGQRFGIMRKDAVWLTVQGMNSSAECLQQSRKCFRTGSIYSVNSYFKPPLFYQVSINIRQLQNFLDVIADQAIIRPDGTDGVVFSIFKLFVFSDFDYTFTLLRIEKLTLFIQHFKRIPFCRVVAGRND